MTTITVDEPAPGLKAIFSFKVPDQRSGKVSNGTMCFQSQDIVLYIVFSFTFYGAVHVSFTFCAD